MENKKEIRAVAVGFSCVDVYEKLGKCYPTGNGVDWGVHLRRMGIPVSVVSVTGDDAYGKTMREMLTGENMEISHLHEAHGDTCQMKMDLRFERTSGSRSKGGYGFFCLQCGSRVQYR